MKNSGLRTHIVEQETGLIIFTEFDKGRKHDFKIFQESKSFLRTEIKCLADKRDRGIKKYHANSLTPKKKPRKSVLTIEDKRSNP